MLRVLLADDHYSSCILLKMLLEENNYQVTTVHDGQEVLDKIGYEKFDMFILDWKMVNIDGDIVAKKLWTIKPDLPIILISAHEVPNEIGKLPFAAILSKPIDINILLATLNKIASRRKNMVTKEAFKKAIEMEKEGKNFYLKAADQAQNELVKKVFSQLAKEEELHIKKIEEIYNQIQKTGCINCWVTNITPKHTFKEIFRTSLLSEASGSKQEIEALEFAAKREEESINYYENLASQTEDSKEKRFFMALSYEERGHFLTILDAIEYLKAPVDWMRMQEKNILEG